MTPPPTFIDGQEITGATIDGQDVQKITVDGQTVFEAFTDPGPGINQYKLDEGSGTTAFDSIASNDLSITGASFVSETNAVGDFMLDIQSGDRVIGNRINQLQGSKEFSFGFTLDLDSIDTTTGARHVMINEDGSSANILTITIANSSPDQLEFNAVENDAFRTFSIDLSSFSGLTRFMGAYTGSGGSFTVYADGVSQPDTGGDPNFDRNPAGFYLGENGAGEKQLEGRIDNCIVFDRELSGAEAQGDFENQPFA
jgi:hypothetical protein